MQPQTAVAFADAVLHEHVVGLLKTDAVPVIVPHHAAPDDCAKTAIKEDTAAPAAIQRHVLLLVPFDHEILKPRPLKVVATHYGKHCRRLALIGPHAIGIQRGVKRKRSALLPGNPPHRSVESAGLVRSEEHTSELQSLRHLVCR